MGGGPDWAAVKARLGEKASRGVREALLCGLATREFTCPTCGAKPAKLCTMRYTFGLVALPKVHDARLTAAVLVYGDDPIEVHHERSP
jgi:transcription elongation factor Elf1